MYPHNRTEFNLAQHHQLLIDVLKKGHIYEEQLNTYIIIGPYVQQTLNNNMSNDVRSEASKKSGDYSIGAPTYTIPVIESKPVKHQNRASLAAASANGSTMASNGTSVSVAVDPVALITTECITVTSAMRKHARWAHSSVSSILGGNSSPMNPGFQTSRPSTPREELATRKGHKLRSSSGFVETAEDGGLANRWGLRGKKGKSMQDNPLMAGFARLRRELAGCKGSSILYVSM